MAGDFNLPCCIVNITFRPISHSPQIPIQHRYVNIKPFLDVVHSNGKKRDRPEGMPKGIAGHLLWLEGSGS